MLMALPLLHINYHINQLPQNVITNNRLFVSKQSTLVALLKPEGAPQQPFPPCQQPSNSLSSTLTEEKHGP